MLMRGFFVAGSCGELGSCWQAKAFVVLGSDPSPCKGSGELLAVLSAVPPWMLVAQNKNSIGIKRSLQSQRSFRFPLNSLNGREAVRRT